jgi:hypothetical protein
MAIPPASRFCRNCGSPVDGSVSAVTSEPQWGTLQGNPVIPPYGGPPLLRANAVAAAPWGTRNVWRQKNLLVMYNGAHLPDRCVRCNEPAHGRTLVKKRYWHHPAWALLILVGLLFYLVAILIVRKSVTLRLGLCERHHNARQRGMAVSWLLAGLGIAMLAYGAANSYILLFLSSILVFLGAAIYGSLCGNVVGIQKADDHYVWLKRVNKDYLSMLPELP